ncbi:MAG: glycosyltransferase family 9 protein [Actinomycetota bacterium]|nr:glycosyltransferase family 9 protein [Actinomycetota bacterium]
MPRPRALVPRALVLRALGLGDLLTAVPALRGIRSALPDHELVLATPAALRPLVELIAAVDGVLPTSGLGPLVAPDGPWDVAVNLHGRGPQSHALLLGLRPNRLIAFGAAGVPGPAWRADEHEVTRWCRLVADGLGAACCPEALLLNRPACEPPVPGAVVVHPGAASGSRRWPAARFGEVAAALRQVGLTVVVTGSAAERALAGDVAAAAGLPDAEILAGRTTLIELAALVAYARLVITGDTGVAHLASAYRTPSVVLFGPVSPSLWGPPGRPEHVTLWHGDGAGDPHAEAVDPALLAIGVPEVLAAAERLLP